MTIEEAIAHAKEVVVKNRKNCKLNTIIMPNRWISNIDCAREHEQLVEWLEELKHYKDLEEQGRLITLPCKIGDTVYEVQETRKRIQEYTVISVHHSHCSTLFGWTLKDGKGVYSNLNGFEEHAIGKTVFLTKEEAEATLKGEKE